jgi:hypothetical protein
MKAMKAKYPPYPGSSYDYAVIHYASTLLKKGNKAICIYCHEQAINETKLNHKSDCPAREEGDQK